MTRKNGFILLTVLIVVFVLSTLGLLRMTLSASRTAEIVRYSTDLQLLYLAGSGIDRAQALAATPPALLGLMGTEYFLGNGSYIIEGDIVSLNKTVTVNSYIPDQANKKYWKTVVITGTSITSNYSWNEI